MELAELEMFVAVVEERSVNRAAARICRSQPAVSVALQKLERECNAHLLQRPRRGSYRLTEAGTILYEFATRMVALRSEAISALREPPATLTGSLVIGLGGAEILRRMAPTLDDFREHYPGIRIEVVADTPARVLGDLAAREIDLLVLRECPPTAQTVPDFTAVRAATPVPRQFLWVVRPRDDRSLAATRFVEMISADL
jgi:DNA-binding transcriptional LysR family regulator